MLYKDWDVILTGKRIRITPMQIEDEPAYGRLLLGELYDRTVGMLGKASTGIEDILNHTESAETHAIRPINDQESSFYPHGEWLHSSYFFGFLCFITLTR